MPLTFIILLIFASAIITTSVGFTQRISLFKIAGILMLLAGMAFSLLLVLV